MEREPSARAVFVVIGAIALFSSGVSRAAVGTTEASHGVTSSGAASYVIPIQATDGIGGLTPRLAISHAGLAQRTILGVGFALSGLSEITPCGKTIAQDSTSAGYAYCLDGARLRLASGTYGALGSTYRTEIDQLARVTIMDAANGHSVWFKVEMRDGLIYEYGRTTDSRPMSGTYSTSPPVLWGVSKVADRSGNSATFHYDTDTVQRRFRPAYVQYTHSTTAGAGRYKVVFVYQSSARPDIAERTIASAPGDVRIREDRLLDRIELKHDDVVYRQYRLTYETGAGANSRLKTVTECAATTAECFPASTLAWQSATSGHAAPSTLTIAGVPIPMDANGDGAEDLVYPSAGTWRLRLGGAAGYGTEINTGLAATNTSKAMALRWNDDDRMDLLVDWSDGKWRVLRGAQNGFESTVVHAGPGAGIASNTASSAWMVADMNGDGKDDLLRAVTTGTSKIYARLNTSTGFAAETLALSNLYYKFPSSPFGSQTDVGASAIRRADFNGDGMTDLTVYACEWDYESSLCMVTQWQMLLSTGAGYQFFWNLPGSTYGVQPRYADFNGDGLTDLAYPSQSPAQWCFGYGQSAGGLYLGCGASTAGYVTFPLIAADYDGDGYDDLYVSRSGTNVWEVLRSTGPAMATTATTTGISSAGGVWVSSDFSGDGLDDLARSGGASLPHLGVPGELLTGATDGFGNAVSFTYLAMSNSTVYTRGTSAAPPQADFQGSWPLVRSV